MVAKSYQSYEQVGEIFKENGRAYVSVRVPSTGKLKKVRFYTEQEYKKMYPEEKIVKSESFIRKVMGFGNKGYIYVYSSQNDEQEEWLIAHEGFRKSNKIGWYSVDENPLETIDGILAAKLYWSNASEDNLNWRSDIEDYVQSIFYGNSNSQWVGEIGARYEGDLRINKVIELDSYYGVCYFHIMEDDAGNQLVWTTSTKKLAEGRKYTIKGGIKEHSTYLGTKQTKLTRCSCLLIENENV